MRIGWFAGLVVAGTAVAAPGQISIKVSQGRIHDVTTQLSQASGCRVSAMSGDRIDLDVTNASLWEVLAKLEVDFGLQSVFQRSMILVENPKSTTGTSFARYGMLTPPPTFTRHWRVAGTWAVALLPSEAAGGNARLVLLGQDAYTIDKIVIDRATSGNKSIKVTATPPASTAACEPAVIPLALDTATKKISLRGHIVVKTAARAERKIAVPLDATVVDIAEGRLRMHLGSHVERGGSRQIRLSWDTMGDSIKLDTAQLVDDQGASVPASGRGSGSSGSAGHQTWSISPTLTKLFVVVKLPTGATLEERVPLKLDNESIEYVAP